MEAVWDYDPPSEHKVGAGEWREAVEIFPDVIENREEITTHSFDVYKTPVEIIWSKREFDLKERKNSLIDEANYKFQLVVAAQTDAELDNTDNTVNLDAIAAAKAVKDARIVEINATTTHEEVDAL